MQLNSDSYHRRFHDLLGQMATIRAALWEIQRSQSPEQIADMISTADQQALMVVHELEALRDELYQLSNVYGQNNHRG